MQVNDHAGNSPWTASPEWPSRRLQAWGYGDVGMGMLNLAGQGGGWRDGDIEAGHSRDGDVGMQRWGAWVEQNGDIEPGRTGPVLAYFHSPKEGISWWLEG